MLMAAMAEPEITKPNRTLPAMLVCAKEPGMRPASSCEIHQSEFQYAGVHLIHARKNKKWHR